MSKRPRRNRNGKQSAEHSAIDQLPMVVTNSPEFQAFEARLEQALETLEGRWSHIKAPLSMNMRRVMPLSIQRRSELA